jgi:hypothetical protein
MACCITFTHNDPLIYVDFFFIILLGCLDARAIPPLLDAILGPVNKGTRWRREVYLVTGVEDHLPKIAVFPEAFLCAWSMSTFIQGVS